MTTTTKNKSKLDTVLESFPLFSKNFIWITDNNNDLIKFELNDAQLEIDELMKTNRFVNILKARQGGISTFVLAKALWRALTKENENILIVSYKSDSAKALFEKLKKMNDLLPRDKYPNVFSEVKRDNRNELLFRNGSTISSVVAGNKDIGRGSTYTYIHLSEFAFYTNQEKQLLSVEQSLAKGSESQLTIESTSNGISNHHYRISMQGLKGKSKYVAYFIPFYHKLYKKQFAHDYDEAEKWHKAVHGKRLTSEDCDEMELSLLKQGANLKQLMWRRFKMSDMESEQDFQQEYPSNALESFISTGSGVFEQGKVLNRLSYIQEPLHKKEVVTHLDNSLHKYINKGLEIYHLPKKGNKYYFGVDTASGGGNDSSTINAYDKDGQEVMSFNHNKVPVYEFAHIIFTLGMFYNYAFLTVERNSYGLPIIERLRKEKGYLNMYKMKTFDHTGKKKLQIGFTTTESSKAIMISDMKEQFELGFINIESKTTLQQMQMFVEVNGRLGNKRGSSDLHHDDSVISTALALQGIKANKWYV